MFLTFFHTRLIFSFLSCPSKSLLSLYFKSTHKNANYMSSNIKFTLYSKPVSAFCQQNLLTARQKQLSTFRMLVRLRVSTSTAITGGNADDVTVPPLQEQRCRQGDESLLQKALDESHRESQSGTREVSLHVYCKALNDRGCMHAAVHAGEVGGSICGRTLASI